MDLNRDFIEKIVLLLITAALSGFFIPFFLKRRDERKLKEQKVFEVELSRQGKIIDSQAKLLEDISQLLWGLQLLALELPYYVLENSQERYNIAATKYDAESWIYLAKIRTEISKSRRLVSDEIYQGLQIFYKNELLSMDSKLSALIKTASKTTNWNEYRQDKYKEWMDQHRLIFETLGGKIDELINLLASEFRLTNFEI